MTSWYYNRDRCPEHPSSCQDDPLSSQTPTPDFVDRGHLDRENDILVRQVLLQKNDHAMNIGVLNITAPVRMTPCPPRLLLQSMWMGVILTGKMTFWGEKCLTKVDHTMKIGVLNIPALVWMTLFPPRFYLTNQIIQNRQTTKPVILIPLKSLTFKWRRTCLVL